MNIFQNLWDKLTNPIIAENLTEVAFAGFIAFMIAFLATPLVARLADYLGAVDLPPKLRSKADSTSSRRIHSEAKFKLGGIAMFIGIILTLLFTDTVDYFSGGTLWGLIIIFIFAILDDIFEMDSKISLMGQFLGAFAFVLGGSTILLVDFRLFAIDLSWYSDLVFNVGDYTYNLIFPADLLTMIWIVGLVNVVSWTDGVDGAAGSISSMAAFFMLIITLARGDILLATIIAIFIGSVLGVLPYNYNPSKIFYSSVGSYVMGYLLAVFAVFGGARWTASITILGLFILDALFVMYVRLKENPEARTKPLLLLKISDKNHLHHRLLAAGYSQKVVVMIETSIMLFLGLIALSFSDLRQDYVALFAGLVFIVVSFSIIAFLKKKKQRQLSLINISKDYDKKSLKEIVIGTRVEDETEEEKFIY